jgi:hypothetical protein
MNDTAHVCAAVVHVSASDQGRKPGSIGGSNLLGGGWLLAFDKSGRISPVKSACVHLKFGKVQSNPYGPFPQRGPRKTAEGVS